MGEESTVAAQPIIISEGEGTVLQAFGDTIQVKIPGEQTGGSFSIMLSSSPPGAGPPPHRHHNEAELFLILEGRYSFWVNGAWQEVGPGSVVYMPRGVPHTFRNVGDTLCRAWVLTTPSGFETFFAKCAAVFDAGGPPDMARIFQICGEHGIEILASGEGAQTP